MLYEDCALEGGDGRYTGNISENWRIWGPNGGYLASIALNAVAKETAYDQPVSLFCAYLNAGKFGPVDVKVDVVKAGRSTGFYSVDLIQNDRVVLRAQILAGNAHEGYVHQDTSAPFTKPMEKLIVRQNESGMAFWSNFETRVEDEVMFSQEGSGRSLYQAWYKFLGQQPRNAYEDAMRSTVLIDTLQWPAHWQRYGKAGITHLAPSLDLYIQFHRFAAEDEWMFCEARCEQAANGFMGGKAETWSRDGRLLASGGSQLICMPATHYG